MYFSFDVNICNIIDFFSSSNCHLSRLDFYMMRKIKISFVENSVDRTKTALMHRLKNLAMYPCIVHWHDDFGR